MAEADRIKEQRIKDFHKLNSPGVEFSSIFSNKFVTITLTILFFVLILIWLSVE